MDTRVIADVQQVRDALETGYNGSAYPDLTNVFNTAAQPIGGNASCVAGGWNNSPVGGGQNNAINAQVNDACAEGGINALVIGVNNQATSPAVPTAYAVWGKISGGYFCIDSTGKTNSLNGTAAVPLNVPGC